MSWARLCVGLGLLVSSAAFAADMPGTLPPPGVAPLLPAPTSSLGWYLRGDIGGYWGTMGGAQSASGFASPTENDLGKGFVGFAGFKQRQCQSGIFVFEHDRDRRHLAGFAFVEPDGNAGISGNRHVERHVHAGDRTPHDQPLFE